MTCNEIGTEFGHRVRDSSDVISVLQQNGAPLVAKTTHQTVHKKLAIPEAHKVKYIRRIITRKHLKHAYTLFLFIYK